MKTFSKKNLKNINKFSYEASNRGLCLPSGIIISEKEIKKYCSEIKKILSMKLSNL